MKRAELSKGMKVALRRGRDWGYSNPKILEIEEVELASTKPHGQERQGEPFEILGGKGVFVIRKGGDKDVVQLRQLLGPWDEIKAEQDRLLKETKAAIDDRINRRAEFSTAVSDYAFVNDLKTLSPQSENGRVSISFEELKALVKRLEGLEIHYV